MTTHGSGSRTWHRRTDGTAGVGSKEFVRGPGAEPLVGFGAKPEGFPILDSPRCAHFTRNTRRDDLVHEGGCVCSLCIAGHIGSFVDSLSTKTASGRWNIFATITFRTPDYPWQRGFPTCGSGRPHGDFAHHLFDRLVTHLETKLGSRVDYVVADQLGNRYGQVPSTCGSRSREIGRVSANRDLGMAEGACGVESHFAL